MTGTKTRRDTSGRPSITKKPSIRAGLPASLDAGLMYVFVVGPGVGESILVRAPGSKWLVVDGCRVGDDGSAPLALLKRYGARQVEGVVLTHPHLDHARGLSELLGSEDVDCISVGCVDGWTSTPTLFETEARSRADETSFASDPELRLKQGEVEHVLAAVRSRWERDPLSRWSLFQGSERALGTARIRVLSPIDAEIVAARSVPGFDPNRLSAALMVSLGSARVVLGGDLPSHHREKVLNGIGWHQVLSHEPVVAEAGIVKVPHHGSRNAIFPKLFAALPVGARTLIVAPFSSQGLPRPSDGEGLHKLLANHDEVHVTALDEIFPGGFKRDRTISRKALNDAMKSEIRPRLRWSPNPRADRVVDVCVTVAVDQNGTVREIWMGRLAATVVA
jgi:beta-lactamase superfamily II metal-dependent hydrolase